MDRTKGATTAVVKWLKACSVDARIDDDGVVWVRLLGSAVPPPNPIPMRDLELWGVISSPLVYVLPNLSWEQVKTLAAGIERDEETKRIAMDALEAAGRTEEP